MAASMMEFSPSGEFFALCSTDGTLRVWDTDSNTLKQEYVSSSHLSATCTCLKWRPERKIVDYGSSKRKKRKSEVATTTKSPADLIALGTSSGNVLLYSVMRGDLQAQWDSGHDLCVNDIAWCTNDVMFSCASDSFIVEWSIEDGKKRHKLTTDGPVHSICLCNGDSMLLSASRSIKLWDLATHTVIQSFTGHATDVFRLLDVPVTQTDENQRFYFVSAAKDERYIQVWQSKGVKDGKTPRNALATLQLPDGAVSLNLSGPLLEDGAYLFSVVTAGGWFLLFRQILNGECKKPLKPKVKIQIATSDSDIPKQLPVLSAMITPSEKLLLSYGDPLKPSFERISYGGLQPENCLIRDVQSVSLTNKAGETSKTKTPVTPDDVKLLTPGHLVPSKPTQKSSGKKKRQRHTSVDMTVEERLDVMGLSEPVDKPNLQTTSSAVLLAQGLQSSDSQILNYVLQNNNPIFIRNTIRKLPIPLIIPLVDELSRRMQGNAQASKSIIGWTKSLLTIHSSYLMTFPELVQNLSTLYQMMDSRVTMFSRLSKLHGKLELVLSQVSDQSAADESDPIEALVTLQDESSDEDMLIPDNEDDRLDNWEDDESELDDEDAEKMEDVDEEDEGEDSKESEEEEEEDSKESEEDDNDSGGDGTKWVDDCNGDDDMEEDE